MIFQRLSANHALTNVVADAFRGGADRLSPPKKRLSKTLTSRSTTSYSNARHRLLLEICFLALAHVAQSIQRLFQLPKWFGFHVGFLDGTTFRQRPLGDIPKRLGKHRSGNSKKDPYWCLTRVVGAVCLASGVVMGCTMGPMSCSEQCLAATFLMNSCWKGWLWVADRNFGIYSVVRAAIQAESNVLVRLTKARAAKLARSAGSGLVCGLDLCVTWSPSRRDKCPAGLKPEPVKGRLLVVEIRRAGYRTQTLYLFTTLLDKEACSMEELVRLYGQRWNVELCFRYIKTQMELEFLNCCSSEMAQKEWLAGLIGYNIIRWVMGAAGAVAEVPVAVLSFSRAREFLLAWILETSITGPSKKSWKRLLENIAKSTLPKRRKPRPPEPRAVRPFSRDTPKLFGSREVARKALLISNAKS